MRRLVIKAKDNAFIQDYKGFSTKLFLPLTFIQKGLVKLKNSGIFAV